MTDLVFGFLASPWTFLIFGAVFLVSSIWIWLVSDQGGGVAVLFGLLLLTVCLGFAAVLWKLQ